MRRVSEHMSKQYHSTGVEKAFRLVASELEAEYLNLDPTPVIFLERVGGREADDRDEYGVLKFFSRELVEFHPRQGYETDEKVYLQWESAREY